MLLAVESPRVDFRHGGGDVGAGDVADPGPIRGEHRGHVTAAANHSPPGVLALPDVDVGLEDLEDLGALGEGEEVLVLGQRGQQPQDEDLADLGSAV